MRFSSIRGLAGFGVRDNAPESAAAAAPNPKPSSRVAAEGGVSKGEGSLKGQDMNPLPQPVPGGWRGFDESHVEKLHALYYNPDIRVSAIAKVFRVSTSTLLRWIDEMGWPSRRQTRRESMAMLREKGAALHAAREQPQVLPVKDAARIGDELDGMANTMRARQDSESETASRPACPGPNGPVPQNEASDSRQAADPADLIASIETQVRQEIALMQQRMHDTSAGAGERNARTLASLVRTLRAVKGIQSESGAPPGPHDHQYDTDLPPRDLAALRQALFARVEKLRAQAEEQERAPQGPF